MNEWQPAYIERQSFEVNGIVIVIAIVSVQYELLYQLMLSC